MADNNYYSIADQDGVILANETLPYGGVMVDDYDDILKLSHATNTKILSCIIYGGKEDCIDLNRYCNNILIQDTILYPFGNYVCTIKGGTSNVTLKNIILKNRGKETDIDIGNWSDQSNELTTNIILDNVTCYDGSPVRVRVLWGTRPTVIGGNVKVTVVPKWVVAIYRFFRGLIKK